MMFAASFSILTILLAICPDGVYAQSGWQQVGGEQFNVAFSGSTAYAISSHGRILRFDQDKWKLAANCPGSAFGIAFRGKAGVVVGDSFTMTTRDAGKSWETHKNVHYHTGALAFPSSDTCYSLTFNKELVRSTDFGRTWEAIRTYSSLQFQAFDFSDARIGYLYADTKKIERTTDAGITWQALDIHDSVFSIRCFGDTVIVISKGSKLSVSTDLGLSWRHNLINPLTSVYPYDISKTLSGTWVAVGFGSTSGSEHTMFSTDQGRNWSTGSTNIRETFFHFYHVNFGPDVGIASGSNGAIYQSNDDGKTWRRVANSALLDGLASNFIYGVSVGKSGKLYTAGMGGSLSESTDEGLTWIEHESDFNARTYRYIHEYSDSILLTCGYDYAFERSTDGGKTWKGNLTFPKLGYSRIQQKGNTLWMAGANYIFRSQDSGISWSVMDSIPLPITEMIMLPEGRFAAVGHRLEPDERACFSISDQNCMNWTTTIFDSIKGLFGLTYLSKDTLMASGRDGLLIVSPDLGKTWEIRSTGVITLTHKLANLNDTLLVGASNLGIIESYDRGQTWRKIDFPELRRQQGAPAFEGVMDVAVTATGKVIAGGGDLLFIKNLTIDSNFTAGVENRPKRNIYLRLKPYPNPTTDGIAKASVWGLATVRGQKRSLALYDMLGTKVRDLSDQINRDLQALTLDVEFDTRDLAKGTYMLVLDAGGDRLSEQIVVY